MKKHSTIQCVIVIEDSDDKDQAPQADKGKKRVTEAEGRQASYKGKAGPKMVCLCPYLLF